jgi:hypothetical protein
MRTFAIGEGVVVRFGERQGQHGEVVGRQLAEVYKVRLPGGTLVDYCGESLESAAAGPLTRPLVVPSKN